MSLFMEPNRICTDGWMGAVSSAAVAWWGHLCLSHCWSLLCRVEAVQKNHSKRNSPHSCHCAKLHPGCLPFCSSRYSCHLIAHSVGCFEHPVLLSELFCLLAQGSEAAILQSDQFLKAAMIHSKFYNCSHSSSYQIYKCGPDPSPFKQMLDNTNPHLRALRGKCELPYLQK